MAHIRPLCSALAKRAAEEMNEVPAKIPGFIHALREWLKMQRHLRTPLSKGPHIIVMFLPNGYPYV